MCQSAGPAPAVGRVHTRPGARRNWGKCLHVPSVGPRIPPPPPPAAAATRPGPAPRPGRLEARSHRAWLATTDVLHDSIVRSAQRGLERLLTLPTPELAAMGSRLAASISNVPTGPGQRPSARGQPPSQIWLPACTGCGSLHTLSPSWDKLSVESDLLGSPSTAEVSRLAKAALNTAGMSTQRDGAHSFRRGWAVACSTAARAPPSILQALTTVAPARRTRSCRDVYVLK
jgi:hypothetical protein